MTRPTYLFLDEIEPKPGNLAEILDKRDEYIKERVGQGVWEMLERMVQYENNQMG